MDIKKLTGIFMGIALLVIIGYDVYAYSQGGTEGTISWQTFRLSHERPVIPFAVGFVCGHLFWQMKGLEKLGLKKIKKDEE